MSVEKARSGRAKSDSLLGDDIAPRRQPRRSIYDVEKTETQPLTGVQGQGRPGGRQGRRDPDHDRGEVRRPPESDNEVEAAAAGGRAGGLRRGRQGQGGWAESCLLYTSDAADDLLCVDLGGRRIIK